MNVAAIVPACRNSLGLKYPLELHTLPNGLTPFDLTLRQIAKAGSVGSIYVPASGAAIGEIAARYGREYEGRPIVYLELEAGEGQDLLRAVNRGCFFASQREEASRFVVIPPGYCYEFAGAVAAVTEAGYPVIGALGGGSSDVRPDFNVNGKGNVVATVGTPAGPQDWRGTAGPFTLTSDESKRLRRYRRFTIEECKPEQDRATLAIAVNLDIVNGNTYAYVNLPGKVWYIGNWASLNWYQEDILEGKVK